MPVISDLVYDAFALIEEDGEKLLREDFMMNILSPLSKQLPKFEERLTWYLRKRRHTQLAYHMMKREYWP